MLFLMSLVVFAIVYMIPGDPVDTMLGQDAEQSAREALRRELGLDQPLWRQYVGWLGRVARGDLGRSIRAQQPVRELIADKLPAMLLLTFSAAVIALLIAFPAGIIAAVKRNTAVDLLAMVGALLGVSIPSFWSGIMLIMIFALTLGWLPAMGYARPTTDHILPNCVSALLVQASVNFANAMVIEAGLSFLGIGTPPPTPLWGLMLNEARAFMSSAIHVAIAPGVAISLAVLGWNLLGDGLRDALDPRLTD